MYDAIVIGGGIVGASTAYHLAREGGDGDVLLIDREDPGRATDAGAGIVSPGSSGYESGPFHRFAVAAARYYPDLVESIEGATGLDTGYGRIGTLTVAVTGDERDQLAADRERVLARRDEVDYPPEGSLREVSPAEARELFPALGEVEEAFYYEDGARVDGRRMTRALLRAAEREGVETAAESAEGIEADGGAVSAVTTDAGEYATGAVVVAGGAWSPDFADDLGVEIPVEPQRGQIAHLDARGTDTAEWPIIRGFRDHYLVPWDDGRIAAGATRESGAGFAPYTTAGGVREVLSEALRVAPDLSDAKLRELRVGLRPLSGDGQPVIGPAPGVDGAYLATGHGPLGLTLGPYTGRVVARTLLGRDVEADLDAFSPGRFGGDGADR